MNPHPESYPLDPARYLERLARWSFETRNRKLGHLLLSLARAVGREGMKDAARILHDLGRSTGVVGPGLAEPYRMVAGPGDLELGWCHNPNRGTPVSSPPNPLGFKVSNEGCYLDLENICQVNHAEPVLALRPDWTSIQYNLLPQIRPFAPREGTHLVIATDRHLPQGYDTPRGLVELAQDLVGWAGEFPEWTVGYNGPGAAASNPHHRHYQVLDCPQLPLFRAAYSALRRQSPPALILDYPLAAVAFAGSPDEVRAQLAQAMPRLYGALPSVSILGRHTGDEVLVVLIPRTPQRESITDPVQCRSGFLEVGGVLLVKSPNDRDFLDRCRAPYDTIRHALHGLEPDGIRAFLKAWREGHDGAEITLVE